MLKNILSLLLSKFYSKQESALVARQSIPNYSSAPTTLALTSTDIVFKATAPFDCFFIGEASMDLTSNVEGATGLMVSGIQVNYANKIFGSSIYEHKSGYARKGDEIKVVLDPWGNTSSRNYEILCYKLIGGGYQALKKLLLQGGGLCLNSLSSSLRRSFLSVRRHGSATSLKPSYQGARKSPLPLILKTIQRRATELYVSILLTLRGQSSALLLIAGGSYFTAQTKQELIKRSRFLSQRVKRSTLLSQRIKAPLVSSSFRPSVLNEVKGGASC